MKRRSRGFTLIEVIVALVIMGGAITILAQGFSTGASASVTAQNRTRAAYIAQGKMSDLEAGIIALNGSQAGDVEEAPGWRWETRSDLSETAGLYQMTVSVFWMERSQERRLDLVRLMRERPAP